MAIPDQPAEHAAARPVDDGVDDAPDDAADRPSRGRRGVAVAVAVVGVVVAATIDAGTKLWWSDLVPLEDLDVYRRAGQAVLDGRPLYEPAGAQLVFTYPPFAGLASVALVPLPQRLAYLLWTFGQVAVVVWLVSVSFAPLLRRLRVDHRILALGGVATALLLTQPLMENLVLGQVNVLLAGLVVADLVPRRRRLPQGVLIGLAAAAKLVPGIFVVYLLVTRRWRAAAVAAATFVAVDLVAWALLPASFTRYWTTELWATDRIGDLAYTSNQSLRGVLERLVPGSTLAWLVVVAAVAVVGLVRARQAHDRGDELAAIAVVGLLGALASPIAWVHHLVWLIPALGVLVGDGRDRRRVGLAVVVTALLVPRIPWHAADALAGPDPAAPVLRPLLGILQDGDGLLALACVLFGPVPRRWRPPTDAPSTLERPVAEAPAGPDVTTPR